MRRRPARFYSAVQEDRRGMSMKHTFGSIARIAGPAALAIVAVFGPNAPAAAQARNDHANHDGQASAELTQIVKEATRPYLDINVAIGDGYGPFLGCVSGPQDGAMGIHYVNGALVGDGLLDATKPEALMYDVSGGRARLLGVEFIVDAATWMATHTAPPVLEGQSFQYVGSPNRYALPAFFELHVWAWRDNPGGTFSDWNTRVSCDQR